jgi:hypothetical protein
MPPGVDRRSLEQSSLKKQEIDGKSPKIVVGAGIDRSTGLIERSRSHSDAQNGWPTT